MICPNVLRHLHDMGQSCEECIGGVASCCDGMICQGEGMMDYADKPTNKFLVDGRVAQALILLYRGCGDPRVRQQVCRLFPEIIQLVPDMCVAEKNYVAEVVG